MQITVEMIETKEFKTKVRGYDPVEVDEFLDAICDEIVALQEEIESLHQQMGQQQAAAARPVRAEAVPAPAPAPKPVAPVMPKDQEETLRNLLVNAQKVSDQTVAEAHARAEAIVADAQKKADAQLASIQSDKEALEAQVDMLKKAAKDYRERFSRLLEDQKHVLNAETELFK